MNLIVIADAITWSALLISLGAATVLSVLASLKPKRAYIWFATGTLGIALAAAATTTTAAPFGLAPIVVVLGLATAAFGGSAAAGTALDLAMGGAVAPGLHGGIIVTDRRVDPNAAPGVQAPERRREVLRGGLTIGVLERIASAGAIVAGFPEALAIVVAVKGVGRFTELEAPEARERFIIGTFASLIWACAAALVVHLAIS
ncbi:hypothetical protein MUN74_00890 [Agromyces endophyticus]|uniref:hypothetical protein n=1 Tax=Agromyces sp. H17E-10 TaxID=2932244 RepID=UPI001FD2D5CE|nr:hypothetical protein [Agromyces sp. H17E-10]UOQ89511.1 hypothetical protein MUN74_00890 [Agromyces sp. H17E-10]